MVVNVVDNETFLLNKAWSIQFFLPQKELNISEDYTMVKMSDIVYERKGRNSCKPAIINYVGLENIESKTGRLVGFNPKDATEIKSSSKVFKKGDILFGRLRPNLNKIFYNDIINDGICSNEILVLVPNVDKVNPVYLAAILRTEIVNQRIISLVKGAALPRVSIHDLLDLEIPLPSLLQQNNIAEKIKLYCQELEECYKRIENIPSELDQLLSNDFIK